MNTEMQEVVLDYIYNENDFTVIYKMKSQDRLVNTPRQNTRKHETLEMKTRKTVYKEMKQ